MLARSLWGPLSKVAVERLRVLTKQYGFSVAAGDLQFLNGLWYVTHAGLLCLSFRLKCDGIRTTVVKRLSNATANQWVFRATVNTSGSKCFVGYGDADPSNVSLLVRGAEMRVAETRAVNRALRKAYGIGLCSVEELGWSATPLSEPGQRNGAKPFNASGNGHPNAQPRLRDQLCLLIRQYNLDPTLVKAYAAHFCGTETLKEASRDLVESFISHLADSAKEDRAGLICKLNSYAQATEVPQ
jgi:hypothetical protein